jgi:D-alanyl-D-alanine carboxypeptidase (penicillin-binding protein 5/6)
VPRSRQRVYLRRRITVGVGIAVVLAIGFYLPITLLAPVGTVAAAPVRFAVPTTSAQAFPMPGYGASAISAVDFGGLLAQGGSTRPLPIASITKIITTLVVLQKKPLAGDQPGPAIRFTVADEAIRKQYAARDGEVYPIRVGGTMSESDVITVALVASANNYARALADWAYGSEAAFLPVANAWLKAHGMTSTVLTDSTGLNSANRSTPTDLIALGKLALADPVVSADIAIRTVTLPVVGAIKNTNTILGKSGIVGIKTGTLIGAGSSLLFASKQEIGSRTVTFIGVILDGPTHPVIDSRIRSMLATARQAFVEQPLTHAGDSFGSYTSLSGQSTSVVAANTASVLIRRGTPITNTVSMRPIGLAKKGTIVGSAKFTVDGKVYSVPLKLTKSIVDPGPWWRLTHPGRLS